MDTQDKYRITYFDPSRWVYEVLEETVKTKSDAKRRVKELLKQYPPQYHSSYIKIEKVELVDYIKLDRA